MPPESKVTWTNTGLIAPGANSVRVLREADMNVVFQPIVDLKTGATFAHEALARCKLPQFESPAYLFDRAAAEEACGRLGRLVRNVLFESCQGLPVFINIHPQEVRQRWLVQPTDPLFLHDTQVYLEVTESAAFEYFDLCMSVLHEVRARSGARIVVDDFGAGHSDLDRVLALQPDVVKLDMALVRGIDADSARQRQVANIIETCHRLGALVVCEGIETCAELRTVIELQSDYAQGYLLGRPAFPPSASRWPLT
jgi:EAL domain-containing protein (putative c-di-GMP-specific phosphodiesterase class I)